MYVPVYFNCLKMMMVISTGLHYRQIKAEDDPYLEVDLQTGLEKIMKKKKSYRMVSSSVKR